MKAFETLDRLTTPDGQELTFHRRDGDFFVYLDGDELMSTRAPGNSGGMAAFRGGTTIPANAPKSTGFVSTLGRDGRSEMNCFPPK